jgi:hypothetical protein
MREAEKLRELAAWYREFAERAGSPAIWESRLRMAEDHGPYAQFVTAGHHVMAADEPERFGGDDTGPALTSISWLRSAPVPR